MQEIVNDYLSQLSSFTVSNFFLGAVLILLCFAFLFNFIEKK